MHSYARFQEWVKQGFSIDIPELDNAGLSQFVIDDVYCVNILASPKQGLIDPIFIYIPILNIQNLSFEEEREILWHIAQAGMPGTLPIGFSLASKKDNGFVWVVGSFETEYMSHFDFDVCIQNAIALARHHGAELNDLILNTYQEVEKTRTNVSKEDFVKSDITYQFVFP